MNSAATLLTASTFGSLDVLGLSTAYRKPKHCKPVSRPAGIAAFSSAPTSEPAPSPAVAEVLARTLLAPAKAAIWERIDARIRELTKYSMEDAEQPPLPDSIHNLRQFLEKAPQAKIPLLSSDAAGNLIATWRKSTDSMLSLKFLGGQKLQFAWSVEESKNKISRDWGDGNCADFLANSSQALQFLE